MTEIKLCYQELQGIEAHFRQIQKNANVLAEKKSAVLQTLPIKSKSEVFPADQLQKMVAESKQPDLNEVVS